MATLGKNQADKGTQVSIANVSVEASPQLPPIIVAIRPRQWIKNFLVFAAVMAAGKAGDIQLLRKVGITFFAFCFMSSAMYLVNDVFDRHEDRIHPRKKYRPIASGDLSVHTALLTSMAFAALSLVLAAQANGRTVLFVLLYAGTTLSYCVYFRKVVLIDLAFVASGFVIRAIAGGAAASIPVSEWFLIVTSGASLLIVAGKRSAELASAKGESQSQRVSLAGYTRSFLQQVVSAATAITVVSYCLWAFDRAAPGDERVWFQLSVIPFALGVLYYVMLVDSGEGGAPEEIFLRRPTLFGLGLLWAAAFGLGVYLK